MSGSRGRSLLRRAPRWAVFFALTYLGIVVVLWLLERKLVFVPSSPAQAWLEPEDARSQDVTFLSSDGNTISARWVPPESPRHGALLLAHGNAGNLTHRGKLAAEWRQSLGTGVLLYDYPGYGKSSGKPSEGACCAANEAAYQWLVREARIAPERLIIGGESLGGGPAVDLATKRDHRALVLIYTFTSLPAAAKHRFPFLPVHTLMRTRFDNLSKIAKCPRPVFLVHGTADGVIPFGHSEQLYSAANPPKHFVRLEGVGHTALPGNSYLPELAKFLAEHAP
ncbi:MAG: alpha/beta hydrolase [Gemmata sp.]